MLIYPIRYCRRPDDRVACLTSGPMSAGLPLSHGQTVSGTAVARVKVNDLTFLRE